MNIKLFILLVNLVCVFSEPLVKISQGTLNGTVMTARYGRNYSAFLGIPYAKPPIGNLRFENPEPATGWSGIRSANSFGHICTQNENGLISGNEDCLFLNVYTPFLEFDSPMPRRKLLPVMVYIHGGTFLTLSSNDFGSGYLMEKDVLLVTFNYRLAIFGFIATNDSLVSGNFGMKDQVLALKWVQKNIRSFGGDSKKVTLFGNDAGGISVGMHAVSKASNGLFQKYIQQSGTMLRPSAMRDKEDIDFEVRNIAKWFSCPVNNTQEMINCLRKIDSNDLIKNSLSTSTVYVQEGHYVWRPTVESNVKGAFLTETPLNSINNNRLKDLPFMSGVVTEEGLIETGPCFANTTFCEALRSFVPKVTIYAGHYYNQDLNKFFPDLNQFYFNNTFDTCPQEEFTTLITNFISDLMYLYPHIRVLEHIAPKMRNKNYFYTFGYQGSISLAGIHGAPGIGGVCHGNELPYLFPTSIGSFKTTNANFTSVDESISRMMVDFWTSFATNGKPKSDELSDPNLWKPFSPSTSAHIQIENIKINTDPTVSMSNVYYTERMNFWRNMSGIEKCGTGQGRKVTSGNFLRQIQKSLKKFYKYCLEAFSNLS